MKQLKHRMNSLSFCIGCFLCLICPSSANVSWNLMSPPGVFGSTIYLLCNITDDASSCHNRIRQWLGGPIYGPLCLEKGCGDDPKYRVMEDTNMCSYILMIHNLTIFDVECDYTCSYGISHMRKRLTLNSEHFIYIPSEEEKISNFSVLSAVAFYSLFIRKIYPSPKCLASYQGENLNKSMEINTTTIGLLYSTEIHVNIPLHPCSGNLLIECILGNRKINVTEKKINGCKGLDKQGGNGNKTIPEGEKGKDEIYSEETTIFLAVVIVAVILAAGGVVTYITIIRKRRNITKTLLADDEVKFQHEAKIKHQSVESCDSGISLLNEIQEETQTNA